MLVAYSILLHFRKLSDYDQWSSLKIHIAMDNAVVIDEIGKIWICLNPLNYHLYHVDWYFLSIEQLCQITVEGSETTKWNPLLLVVPLRLGLLNINPIYIESLKVFLYTLFIVYGSTNQFLYINCTI